MPNAKSQVKEVLDRLPDDCSMEDVQYHLYVAETIRHRLELEKTGKTFSQEEVEARMSKWIVK